MTPSQVPSRVHVRCWAAITWTVAVLSLLALAPRLSHGQVCSGDVHLTSQSEVDAFNCTSVAGVLHIEGADITNLDGLSELTSVGSNLLIHDNSALTSVDGLSSLTSIGLDLELDNNDVLTNVDGLLALALIGDDLRIVGNDALVDINGFLGLTSVGGDLSVDFNVSLSNLDGFSEIASITSDFSVFYNIALVRCCGLADVLSGGGVGGIVDIFDNGTGCNSEQDFIDAGACAVAVEQTVWGVAKAFYR